MAADWKLTAAASGALPVITSLGNGLALAFGTLAATVTSGIGFDGSGNIVVKNGSGIALDGGGNLTINAGVGLTLSSGFLVVNAGTGLSTSGGQVFIPGGAITTSLLAALAVTAANIANGTITNTQIAAATIQTANIANAAITNALLGNAVVGTANIQNAAITNALIANLAVDDAQIASVGAGKITAGSITVAVAMTQPNIVSTVGSAVITLNNGFITSTNGVNTATLTTGHLTCTDGTFTSNHDSGSSDWNAGATPVLSCSWAGIQYNSGSSQLNLNSTFLTLTNLPLVVGATVVIDASANIICTQLKVTGLPQFAGTNSTGSGAAALGSNSPAGSLTAPDTWIEVKNAAGSSGWIPMWV